MKLKSLLYSALCSVAFIGTGCTENQPEYTPAEPSETPEIYFSAAAATSFNVGETDTEFTVTVYRSDDATAATYPLQCVDMTDASKFNVPASVSFAAGEKTSEFTVTYDATQLEGLVPYKMTFVVGDGINTPYALQRVTYTINYFPWVDVVGPNGEEFATWTDDFLTTLYNMPDEYLTFEVKLQKSPAIEGLYRVVNPYANCPLFGGNPYDENNYFYLNASNPNEVFLCDSEGKAISGSSPVYYNTDIYFNASYGTVSITGQYNYQAARGNMDAAAQFAGTLSNGVLKFATPKSFLLTGTGSVLSGSLYYCDSNGTFKIVWPGVVEEADPDDVWESIGNAEFTDPWITPLYSEEGTPETWTVEVEQYKKDPNLYRLVNPYKDGVLTDGWVYEGDKYIVIDATNPQCLKIEPQVAWYDEEAPINGNIEVFNAGYAYQHYVQTPLTDAQIISQGLNDTFANQVFTIGAGHAMITLPDTQDEDYEGAILTTTQQDGKIVLSAEATAVATANHWSAAMKNVFKPAKVRMGRSAIKSFPLTKRIRF